MNFKNLLTFILVGSFLFPSLVEARGKRPMRNRINLEFSRFETDGCSSYPDGDILKSGYSWLHCCIVHDMPYWIGGTLQEKLDADKELQMCVAEASSETHGTMMEWGVFVGGSPFFATPWRWGYGWNKLQPFKELSSEKREKVKVLLDSMDSALLEQSQYLDDDQWNYVMEHMFKFKRTFLEESY